MNYYVKKEYILMIILMKLLNTMKKIPHHMYFKNKMIKLNQIIKK